MFHSKPIDRDLLSTGHPARAVHPLSVQSELESTLRARRSSFLDGRNRTFSTIRNVEPFAPYLPDSSQLGTFSNNTAFSVNTRRIAGTFRADRFTIGSEAQTVISGNGNVDFGRGDRDWLDLSNVLSNSVSFSWAHQAGVVYNPGNGSRVFDAINFANGKQILFEGIDAIRFADGTINLSAVPNDPWFGEQWNLHMMGVQNAWRFTTGSSSVLVGVEDSGLVFDQANQFHPDLARTFAVGTQVIDDRQENHGTSVQGIIAATSNNGIGLSGINWNSNVVNIDVLGNEAGDLTLVDATRSTIAEARRQGQRLVINFSLGIPGTFGQNFHQDFEQVVRDHSDVVFVIASGNEGWKQEGLSSPAVLARSYANVIAVGAVWGTETTDGALTTPGTRAFYSQYGDGLTVVAPSDVIAPTSVTTWSGVEFAIDRKFGGTSSATPNVTGVVSLILSANPGLSASQVKTILAQTSIDVGQAGYDKFTGSGVVNAEAAVRRAIAIGRGAA